MSTLYENLINQSIYERYRSDSNYIETFEQNNTSKDILSNEVNDIVYVAPTSYGKSSLVKDIINELRKDRIIIFVLVY